MSASTNKRLIRIQGDEIYFTPAFCLPLTKTNLPYGAFTFRTSEPFYWEIELIRFERHNKLISIRVVNFYPLKTNTFKDQKMKHEVQAIHFEKLIWGLLEPFLSSYNKQRLLPYITDSKELPALDRTEKIYDLSFSCYFKDARFKLGYVSCFHIVPMLNDELEFQIPNSFIIPEFEFIKNYFSQMLKRKTFQVKARVTMKGFELSEVTASSPQISKIDNSFVETIKIARVMQLQKEPLVKVLDKSLFTEDEVFNQFNEEQEGNVFNQNARDIIQILSDYGLVRNRKQIQYLAGKKQSTDQKIFITLNPVFGFVFFIEGQDMYHLCWELLNSHATYVWSFDKLTGEKDPFIKRVGNIIQTIREQGRTRYKQAYHYGHTDEDILFQTITHHHAESSTVDPFPGWKHRLEEKLI